MPFEYLTNVPLEKARSDYLALLEKNGFAAGIESVPVQQSSGRITANAVYAKICAPHYAASAMDGIAVRAKDTFGATETTPVVLDELNYITVDTGDPLPEGCDAVIMVEDIVKNQDESVTIHSSAAPWQHIRQIGEDICAGEMILPSYTEIGPAAIGSMIAGGVLSVDVLKKPVVGIIPTGDEIVEPCDNPKPGDILEFNSSIFSSMVNAWGCISKVYPIVKDEYELIKSTLEQATDECDLVILNAGSSAGRDDYSSKAISEVGEMLYHGIAIKPGKPAILGIKGPKAVLGVPGYPVSGIIVVEQLLKPLVDRWYKRVPTDDYGKGSMKAKLSRPLVSGLKYEEFVRCRLGFVNNTLIASPLSRGAGVVSSFMKADGMIVVDQNTEGFEAGEEVEVKLMTGKERLENTIVVIGSHDPLLDELGNMLHRKNPALYMNSSHVGSMGGIMAMRRGESHAAGCHLLDTETGRYNLSFMRKYFPNHNVKLIRCVGRQQGLMLAKDNPLGIKKFSDIAQDGCRYVNRQKGSGTRILMDYLCSKEKIHSSNIYGYEREEMTHTSVAAQIASGSADAGLGIFSAAQLYGLDFLPICIEEYDLIIPDYAFENGNVAEMLETMKSEEFKNRLLSMGGYTVDGIGEEIEY